MSDYLLTLQDFPEAIVDEACTLVLAPVELVLLWVLLRGGWNRSREHFCMLESP